MTQTLDSRVMRRMLTANSHRQTGYPRRSPRQWWVDAKRHQSQVLARTWALYA